MKLLSCAKLLRYAIEQLMLLVKTKIGPSKINGIGLFADQFIPKGTITWRFTPGFDLAYSIKDFEHLPELAREYVARHCYKSKRSHHYVLCSDNARFLNHYSDNPSILDAKDELNPENIDVAARDIHPGEEMTCDYSEFDAEFHGFPK